MINKINKKSGNLSVISEHRLQSEYDFDWNNTKILGNERYIGKRLG